MNEVTLKLANTLCYHEDKIPPTSSVSTAPQPDGALNTGARIKNNHYRQKYAELPEPVVFIPVTSSTSGRINEEFLHCSCTSIGKVVI